MSCIVQPVCAPYDTSLYGDGELYGSSEFYDSGYVVTIDDVVPQALSVRIAYSNGAKFHLYGIRPIVARSGRSARTYGQYVTVTDTPCPKFLAVRIRYSGGAAFKVTAIYPDVNVKRQTPTE